jgi:hypothetical protein
MGKLKEYIVEVGLDGVTYLHLVSASGAKEAIDECCNKAFPHDKKRILEEGLIKARSVGSYHSQYGKVIKLVKV